MTKQKKFRFFPFLLKLLGLTAAAAVCFVAVLMLSGQFEDGRTQPPAQGAAPLQAGQTVDFAALQDAFGASLPCLPGQPMQGLLSNVHYNGHNVRRAVQQYEGFTITALQPSFAAPLLMQGQLSLSLEGELTVAGLPAALAEGENEYCFYFSTEEAAYSLHAAGIDKENFLSLAALIAFPNE